MVFDTWNSKYARTLLCLGCDFRKHGFDRELLNYNSSFFVLQKLEANFSQLQNKARLLSGTIFTKPLYTVTNIAKFFIDFYKIKKVYESL